jgi:two-component system cell cycle sensor histidine kinase/response regulator CckA
LMNLIVNARDAMAEGGMLAIEVSRVELARTPLYHAEPLTPGTYVRLSVSDTGCGMDRQTQSHIFEPFFTTKEEGKGSGLGLSTVFGIVTQCGGGIDVTSRIGHGTRFDIYFPVVQTQVQAATVEYEPGPPCGGTETILLVEDDSSVRTVVRDQLQKLGYTVIEAKNGLEACLLAGPQVGAVNLLVTDIIMPGMGGRELAQQLSAIKPDLRTLFISGYTDDIGVLAGQDEGVAAFLQKPFTPEVLARSVRHLLDGAARSSKGLAARSS